MNRSARLLVGSLVSCFAVAAAVAVGCGGTSETTTGAGGDTSGPGPGPGPGSGGMTSSSTETMAGPGSGGGCMVAGGKDPNSYGMPCCSKNGGTAHCVPTNEVPPDLVANFGTCAPAAGGMGVCVPDEIITIGEGYTPTSCASIAMAPGVCLSLCIDKIAKDPNVGLLMQGTCLAGDVCVPCINPLTKMSTGACDIKGKTCDMPDGGSGGSGAGGGDAGGIMCPYMGPPVVDPNMFPACAPACNGAHCVPANLVPAAQQKLLASCDNGMGFCAPDPFIASGGEGLPKTCTSVAGAEGRCLSTCLPDVAAQAQLLPVDVCAADERCAPCFNPTAADPNAATGACTIACDMSTKPPVILSCPWNGPQVVDPSKLPDCAPACGGAHCLPAMFVPPAEQAQLAQCAGGFCAPDPIISAGGEYVPPNCDPFPGTTAEGRCLSDCIPAIQAQTNLSQGACNGGELCAPCTDPFNGSDTNACTTACDSPKSPPFTFPLCCDVNGQATGTCVPGANVPPGQAANLMQDVCPNGGANYLCVPDEYLPTPTLPVDNCTGSFGGLGTCISECVSISFAFLFSQDVCPDNHLCVDCAFAPAGTPGCP